MIVLICGGRNFGDMPRFRAVMAKFTEKNAITCVVQGGARGADLCAKLWAKENNIHMAEVNALWENGKGAGLARNSVMLSLGVDCVIAFPGGKGTADTVRKAFDKGIPVWTLPPEYK